METTQLIILQKDLDLLKSHLLKGNLSEYNKKKLLSELKEALVVNQDTLPADVICLNSYVEIMDVAAKHKFNFRLVMPAEADMKKNRISVFAPIGIALLGYRTGAKVEWEMPNGIKTFEILKVMQNQVEQEV